MSETTAMTSSSVNIFVPIRKADSPRPRWTRDSIHFIKNPSGALEPASFSPPVSGGLSCGDWLSIGKDYITRPLEAAQFPIPAKVPFNEGRERYQISLASFLTPMEIHLVIIWL